MTPPPPQPPSQGPSFTLFGPETLIGTTMLRARKRRARALLPKHNFPGRKEELAGPGRFGPGPTGRNRSQKRVKAAPNNRQRCPQSHARPEVETSGFTTEPSRNRTFTKNKMRIIAASRAAHTTYMRVSVLSSVRSCGDFGVIRTEIRAASPQVSEQMAQKCVT